jgi:hypothetical protein
MSEAELLDKYCSQQAFTYQEMIKRNPKNKKYEKGWLKRAAWKPPNPWK